MHPQDRLARVVRLCFSRVETCCRSETTDDSTHESSAPGLTLLDRVPHHTTCIVSIDLCGHETVDHGRLSSERLSPDGW